MAPRSQVPKFGNWENGEDVPYTAYFEKAKKGRNLKTNTQIPDSSSNNEESSFQAREEVDVRNGELTKSEPERPKDQNSSGTNHKTRVSREEVDLIKSTGSPTQPKRTSRQSVGSDRSFDSSPMHPHQQARVGNKSSVSSEGNHSTASSTPGRSRLRQITRGDENAREEADVRNGESTKSEPERPKDQNLSRTNHETRVSREEVDLIKSTGSSTHPKKTSRQSVGSDWSFESSPMHPHHQARVGNKGSVSSESSHSAASLTPGRSRLRQVTRGDENLDDGSPAIPKFGDWDDTDPATGECYTEVFNKAREDKQSGGGKSTVITTEDGDFYGLRHENSKGCSCFHWSRK